jgi:lipopolysaccharide/colanic/teichoic acid biosynthesis glycosyltransferase
MPLSVALFDFSETMFGGSHEERLRLIQRVKRETDVMGYVDTDVIGVLLPDTNEQGTKRFVQKVTERAHSLVFSCASGTYPDQVFESLGNRGEEPVGPEAVFLDQPADAGLAQYVKRGIDILGALVALVLASPVMIVAALWVAATSPGPVLFKQVRLGRRGVPFVFYKFRSMYRDADSKIHRDHVISIIKSQQDTGNNADAGKAWAKLESDPRITPVGRFLRKTSIDELPQLFCVLKGDLSLVGPRPPLPYEGEVYQPWHLRRVLESKPGITGLWQVNGRGTTSFDDMVRLDLQYACEWSLALDLRILLKTVAVVLRRQGAS